MIVISDTSALSAFAETDLLSGLPAIFGSIVITASVHHECRHPGAPAHLQAWIGQPPA